VYSINIEVRTQHIVRSYIIIIYHYFVIKGKKRNHASIIEQFVIHDNVIGPKKISNNNTHTNQNEKLIKPMDLDFGYENSKSIQVNNYNCEIYDIL